MKSRKKEYPKGIDLLHDPIYNKGTAFSYLERQVLNLEGLLPPHMLTMEEQKMRVLSSVRAESTSLGKYLDLIALQDRNETLFYNLISENIEEFLPIIYTPTVGLACQQFGQIFRRPRGMYISIRDKGFVKKILRNWPRKIVDIIVVTDGERILGLGDLGSDGMGIPIGKLSLYTVCAGIDPENTLPITIDVGTNNEKLLNDPLYIGLKQKRITGIEYDELIDEFVEAANEVFQNVLIQFEDFANQNAYRLLEKYRKSYCVFNDDIQGTGSVILSGLFTAMRLINSTFEKQKFLFIGSGSAALGIAEDIVNSMELNGIPKSGALQKIFFFDSKGLVVQSRNDLNLIKQKFAQPINFVNNLFEAVKIIKPTTIIGVSGQPKIFTEEIIKEMSLQNARPIILALSNPTSKSECTAEEAYTWSNGKSIFASGSPFDPVNYNGKIYYPGQGNNAYIFPGIGLGVKVSKAKIVTDEMFIIAARTLANMISQEDLKTERLYPSLKNVRKISLNIATAVAEYAFKYKLARVPQPENILKCVQDEMYLPVYKSYI